MFIFIGTEIEAEQKLPLHQQPVRDAQGRIRLHGAFQGGFSAGYYNTVGSKEGWAPKEFKSSRSQRQTYTSRIDDFMDESDMAEFGAQIAIASAFDSTTDSKKLASHRFQLSDSQGVR